MRAIARRLMGNADTGGFNPQAAAIGGIPGLFHSRIGALPSLGEQDAAVGRCGAVGGARQESLNSVSTVYLALRRTRA